MKIERVQCSALNFGCSVCCGYIISGNDPRESVEIAVAFPQRRSTYVVSYRKVNCLFMEVFSSDSLDECKEYAEKLAADIAKGRI